uniref:Uncharacterized protein n=1 Tax=Rhizophora mucronata TaxID=61149 RepID=A0A2P2QFS3_RHIMU
MRKSRCFISSKGFLQLPGTLQMLITRCCSLLHHKKTQKILGNIIPQC